ncbi:cathelicidin-7-like, partial [Gracilinanus agilis]|uniref:cathelicidin-7-like n=1 Tax=Gracilinanus agilis TaxID=191870 RepID=UPI001CFD4390
MENLRKVLLLVSMTTLIPALVLSQSSLRDGNALYAAIHFYNQVHGTENVFKVLEAQPPPSNEGAHEQRLKFLSFTMKETVCPRTKELPLDQCDFKRDGLVKKCQASVSNGQDIAAIILTCDPGALL